MNIEERIKEKAGISISSLDVGTYLIEDELSAYVVMLESDEYGKLVNMISKVPDRLNLTAKNIAGYIISSGLPIMKIDMPKLKTKKPTPEDYDGLGAADI